MVLSLITKDRSRQRPLRRKTSDLLKAYYAGNATVSEGETVRAQRIFSILRNKEYYVVCDCERPNDDECPVVLTLLEAENSPLRVAALPGVLRAMPSNSNTPHNEQYCVFSLGSASTSFVAPSTQAPRDDNLAVFSSYPKARQLSRGRAHQRSGTNNSFRPPSISQVLFRVIEEAKLNTFDGTTNNRPHSLRAFLASQTLHLAADFSLQKALVTGNPDEEDQGVGHIIRLKQKITNVALWPEGTRPQGFWCGVVSGYRSNVKKKRFDVTIKGWENLQHIETRPHVFGGYIPGSVRQPYIAIFGYALPEENSDTVQGLRCFMQPCLDDDCWFPVDSDYERRTLRELIHFKSDHPELGIIKISKPLFDQQVGTSQSKYCKPDFIVTFKRKGDDSEKEVAIETMGFADVDYEARKSRTHPLMLEKYKGLIQHCFAPGRTYDLLIAFRRELEEFLRDGAQPLYRSLQNGD